MEKSVDETQKGINDEIQKGIDAGLEEEVLQDVKEQFDELFEGIKEDIVSEFNDLDEQMKENAEGQRRMKKTKAQNGNLIPQSSNTAFNPFRSKADGTYSCCVTSCEWFCLDIDGECLEEEDVWYCITEVDD